MILDENQSILYQDACNNYETSRYKDAFIGFQYLMANTVDQSKISNFLYFAYRAYTSSMCIEEALSEIRLLRQIGEKSLTFAAKSVITNLEMTKDLRVKAQLLEELQQVLKLLGEEEKQCEVIVKLTSMYRQLAEEHDITEQEKLNHLERMAFLLQEIEDFDGSREVLSELAEVYRSSAETMREMESESYEIEYKLQKAMEIYEKIGDEKRMDLIRTQLDQKASR